MYLKHSIYKIRWMRQRAGRGRKGKGQDGRGTEWREVGEQGGKVKGR